MPYKYDKESKPIAKGQRKNMTEEEKNLWYKFFKQIPYTVNRKKMIGHYIVDFYCHSAHVAVEIDGLPNSENKKKDREAMDAFLNELGIKVLRYTTDEINANFKGVCLDIYKYIAFTE